MIRLNRYIASCGICSRRNADTLIQNGQISVNDKTVIEPGYQVDPEKDRVAYNNKVIKPQDFEYLVFYKPRYVLSSCKRDPLYPRRKIITDFLSSDKRLFYAGRLDFDAEGLIFLTNDGMMVQKLAHPRYEIEKKYHVNVTKKLSSMDFALLRKGFIHEGSRVFMKQIEKRGHKDDRHEYLIVLTQGMKRQIKIMLQHVGTHVISIKRVAFGPLALENLQPGQWRYLSVKERRNLLRIVEK